MQRVTIPEKSTNPPPKKRSRGEAQPQGQPEEPGRDPMRKIRPLLDDLNRLAPQAYMPGQAVSIDESMCGYKGRFAYRQFVPNKRTRFGIKMWVLCDSATGYILRATPYTGAWTEYVKVEKEPLGTAVVKHLLSDYRDKGNVVYTDNYYTSPELYADLRKLQIGACGTMVQRRKGMPDIMGKNFPCKKRGEPAVHYMSEFEDMLCAVWKDKKNILVVSTVGQVGSQQIKRNDKDKNFRVVNLPDLVNQYNQNMGGVDLSDMRRSYYKFHHPTRKYYIALFEYLHESVINNALVTFSAMKQQMGGDKVSARDFRLQVINSLLTIAFRTSAAPGVLDPTCPQPASTHAQSRFPGEKNRKRLTSRCFPKMANGRARCEVCKVRNQPGRIRTKFFCDTCSMDKIPVFLCVPKCFTVYHTHQTLLEGT